MCIILDANLFSEYLQNTPDMAPVRQWLEGSKRRRGKLAYSFRDKLVELRRAGLLKEIPTAKVAEEEDKLPDLKSDDPHVVALAVAGRVSVLVSKDQALHQDFKGVVKGGKVYQTAKHRRLLTPDLCK